MNASQRQTLVFFTHNEITQYFNNFLAKLTNKYYMMLFLINFTFLHWTVYPRPRFHFHTLFGERLKLRACLLSRSPLLLNKSDRYILYIFGICLTWLVISDEFQLSTTISLDFSFFAIFNPKFDDIIVFRFSSFLIFKKTILNTKGSLAIQLGISSFFFLLWNYYPYACSVILFVYFFYVFSFCCYFFYFILFI